MNLAALLLFSGMVSGVDAPVPVPIHAPPAETEQRAVRDAVGARSYVLLGETIHLTNELAPARLPFVSTLHEAGFDVLALEGSAIDAWLAEDILLSGGTVDDAQKMAWLPIWQTASMRELMAYVASTKGALTLSSFDLQIGSSRATGMGRGAYEALFTALAKYVPAPADVDTAMLARELQAMSRCQPDRCPWTPADTKRTGPAIATVSTWIEGAMPIVAAKTTPAHARALGVLRALLARRLMLVEETGAAKEPERKVVFAKTRDKLMAEMAAALHDDVSASHKVMLWGHNRHVNLSPTGAGHPSMGRRLADVDRDAVYAIGTFVGSGRALLLEDDEKAALDISERVVVDASRFSVDARLQEAAAGVPVAFFDLAGARTTLPATSPWRTRGASRLEGGQMDLALVDDYDGALWVSSVTAPELPGLSTAGRWLVRLHGVWSDHGFALSGLLALLTLGALYGVVALASRKKS